MKNVINSLPIAGVFLCVFLVACGFALKSNDLQKEEGRIEVSFNRKMQFNDLVKLKLDLAEAGLTLQYQVLEFDGSGGLKSLAFKVDCNDGFSGSATSNAIYNNTRWGFYRDYRPNIDSPFGTGALK
jgi:hypothetical protein